ncbi:hypothetical protein [Haloferax denitrificans]|uniref:Uncharacterized protein n=1 Tax=Haloferax denitrificans ATCC 35960 TaxID=662478 RepID=M0J1W3_9EURY|nr:hypothetical protein C438_13761 [Haloferax denitrificans ATCC 35960]
MSSSESTTEGAGVSLRNAVLVVPLLFMFHLGRGWARGLVEGNYARGVVGLALTLVPIVLLLFVTGKAYF